MTEPRTHYQLSFTARQAVVFFLVCLFALGLSFFLGLMAGLSGRPSGAAAAAPASAAEGKTAAGEVALEPGAAPAEPRLTGETAGEPAAPAPEPTAPAVLQAFEDRGTREPTPAPLAPAASGVWIQVASLAARAEAEAFAERFSRHGYRAQVAEAAGPKGRVFRVRVGPYRSEEEAGRVAERLRRQEKIRQTWVVREGG